MRLLIASLGVLGPGFLTLGCNGTDFSGSLAAGGTVSVGGSVSGQTTAAGGKSATSSASPSGGNSAQSSAPAGGAATGGQATGGTSAPRSSSAVEPTGGRATAVGGQASGGKSTTLSADAGGRTTGGRSATGGVSGSGQAAGGKSATGGASGTIPTAGGKTSLGGSGNTAGQSSAVDTSSGKSAGCGKASSITSSQYNNGQTISITAGGKQRRFILNVPTNYDNSHPYRLIVVYHQLDGNDKQMFNWKYYGLLPLSNNSTIFVAPNGQKNGSPCSGTGDGDSGCGWPNTSDSDLALADAVVAQIEENFCVDTTRIFATGWSYGGSMSYRTACSRPQGGTAATWGVRGIAIYSAAQLSGNCTPSKSVAFYASHGTHDGVLNYDNMGIPLAQNFAKANGCTWATPTKVSSGTHACTNLTGCTAGFPLEFCSFNGDHTPFPDTGQSQGSWGPQEAWKFLSQF